MAGSRSEPRVFFPWERRRGLRSLFGRARARQALLVVGGVVGVLDAARASSARPPTCGRRAPRSRARSRGHRAWRADHDRACPASLADLVAAGYLSELSARRVGAAAACELPGHAATRGVRRVERRPRRRARRARSSGVRTGGAEARGRAVTCCKEKRDENEMRQRRKPAARRRRARVARLDARRAGHRHHDHRRADGGHLDRRHGRRRRRRTSAPPRRRATPIRRPRCSGRRAPGRRLPDGRAAQGGEGPRHGLQPRRTRGATRSSSSCDADEITCTSPGPTTRKGRTTTSASRRPTCRRKASDRAVGRAQSSHARRATRALAARGLTLIEIIVVLAIVALVTGVAIGGSMQLPRRGCAGSATMIASAIKVGVHAGDGDVARPAPRHGPRPAEDLARGERRADARAVEGHDGGRRRRAVTEAEQAGARRRASRSSRGRPSRSRASRPSRRTASATTRRRARAASRSQRGITFRAVQTTHDDKPRTSGRAYLYFWPGGRPSARRSSSASATRDDGLPTLTLARRAAHRAR